MSKAEVTVSCNLITKVTSLPFCQIRDERLGPHSGGGGFHREHQEAGSLGSILSPPFTELLMFVLLGSSRVRQRIGESQPKDVLVVGLATMRGTRSSSLQGEGNCLSQKRKGKAFLPGS